MTPNHDKSARRLFLVSDLHLQFKSFADINEVLPVTKYTVINIIYIIISVFQWFVSGHDIEYSAVCIKHLDNVIVYAPSS